MAEHTPGPWIIDGPTGYANHPGCMVYAPHDTGHLVAMCPPEYADNQQANARLIAAAPDLLAACRHALDCIGDISLKEPIQAAIAKAIQQ